MDFGRDICGDLLAATSREWLVVNGIGGFASGTIAGALTRRYHGLLIAALSPPLGRTLLCTKIEETVRYAGLSFELGCNEWKSGVISPAGYRHIERFRLEGTTPTWTFSLCEALLEKRIFMRRGKNTTYVLYRHVRGSEPVELSIKILGNYRDYHGATRSGWPMQVDAVKNGLRVLSHASAQPYYILSPTVTFARRHEWYRDFALSVEKERGFDAVEDHLFLGEMLVTLSPGASLTIAATTDFEENLDGEAMFKERQHDEQTLYERAGAVSEPPAVKQLILAADQFIVDRPSAADEAGSTIIAGYPWFGDWGRDTMIALPGLTLFTGRPDRAKSILKTFARFIDRGMLPNRFPDAGDIPEYNTADATLHYFEALRAYHMATLDDALLRELYPLLQEIIACHERGTRHGIYVTADGLLHAGEPGVQVTWMDAKIGDWVVTPRHGKPVEINALWYNALCVLADFALHLSDKDAAERYREKAERVKASFDRFINPRTGSCFDVIDGPDGNDARLRPNQILAVSLLHSPLRPAQQRAVVNACARNLLTSHGLRSLAPGEPDFIGRYEGDPRKRDSAYHQGAVWSWLLGPFVIAHYRVYGDAEKARSYLLPLLQQESAHGLGTISEIFDGDPPHTPRGCIAQAWSVAEWLRAYRYTTRL